MLTDTREITAELCITHSTLSAAQLESQLQASADEAWSVGENFRHSWSSEQKVRSHSRWAIRETVGPSEELSSALARLTARADEFASGIARLPRDATVELRIFVTEPNGIFGLGVEPATIELLARLHAGLEMSFVVGLTEASRPAK